MGKSIRKNFTFSIFKDLYYTAKETTKDSKDKYILSSAADLVSLDEFESCRSLLTFIFNIAHSDESVNSLIKHSGMDEARMADLLNIGINTFSNWTAKSKSNRRKPPDYTYMFMAYIVAVELYGQK